MAEAFPGIGTIRYEGPQTKNMLAFRHYDPDALVEGKPMRDHLRFAVSYWHTMRGTGGDPFGPGTMVRPWETESDPLKAALKRVDVAFEFLEKLGCDFYCFHDRDAAPWPTRSKRPSSGPARSCSGARRICSRIRGTCTAPPRARMPRCSPTRRPR
jgi:xylose isomerase